MPHCALQSFTHLLIFGGQLRGTFASYLRKHAFKSMICTFKSTKSGGYYVCVSFKIACAFPRFKHRTIKDICLFKRLSGQRNGCSRSWVLTAVVDSVLQMKTKQNISLLARATTQALSCPENLIHGKSGKNLIL